ncbi:MAG: cadherin domain-containing protein, partial [Rhodoferax sp.]|nr:cadherin domain-containing protein [Rhodoferax sp.]
ATDTQAISYSLKASTGDAAAFSINSSTGAVTLTGSPDFEAKQSYNFTVVATDAAGNAAEQAVTLAVRNVDEIAPAFSNGSSATATAIAENSAAGSVVYTAAATDTDFIAPHTASSVTYSLKAGAGDESAFSIHNSTGAVTLTDSPDFETKPSYRFTVVATDAAGNAHEQAVTLAITNVNEAPSIKATAPGNKIFITGSNTVSLHLRDVFQDGDAGDSLSYSLPNGDSLPTGLVFSNGILSGTPTGSDSSASFTFTATDSDGLTVSKTIQIEVSSKPKVSHIAVFDSGTGNLSGIGKQGESVSLDVTLSETVTFIGTPSSSNLQPGFSAGGTALTGIHFVNHTTVDGKTVLHFTATLPGGNASSVVLTGLTIGAGLTLTGNTSNLAMDSSPSGLTVSDSYTLDNTPPSFTSSASAPDIAENSAAGRVVYTAVATDTQAISYSLKASTGDAAAFSINSST